MHEFANKPGWFSISELSKEPPKDIRPLGASERIVWFDTQMFDSALKWWNRKNIKTLFVFGYGAYECVLYTRHNSVSYISDLYPEVNIVVVEEGVDTKNSLSKWAISNYRSFAMTTHVSDIFTAYGLDAEETKVVLNIH